MKRIDIINQLIERFEYKTYLEVGTQSDFCLKRIRCGYKVGVDPEPLSHEDKNSTKFFKMTSDDFFKQNKETFDIIFIDGLHEANQVYKDIQNSLKILNEGGTIVCHDMSPGNKAMQQVPRMQKEWTGNGWESFVKIRQESELTMMVVDTDHGCGIIRKDHEFKPLKNIPKNPTYEQFDKNRKEWLNLITIEEFKKIFNIQKGFKIWEFQPYDLDGNIGRAYNEYCSIVPSNEDWICFYDADFMVGITPGHGHLLHDIVKANPNVGLFTCWTNRVKNEKQILKAMFDESDIKKHRKVALANKSRNGLTLTDHSNRVISGYMMLFKKQTWLDVGGFSETGMLGIDNKFSRKIAKAEMHIKIINGLYGLHYYRLLEGMNDKSHLK